MNVVLADVEEEALTRAEEIMTDTGATVLAVQTDVSKATDIEALAEKSLDVFGAVHLLFNNAGVDAGGTTWDSTLADWEWVIGVDLWGVIHGVRVFVPLMLEQDTECHIVNTASVAGLISGPGLGAYKVAKHGVVTLSEALHLELAQKEAKVKVSVLCPGFVATRILDSGRNRPAELANEPGAFVLTPEVEQRIQWFRKAIEDAMPPSELADHVFNAIREERFYILPHPEFKAWVETRMEDILQDRNPTLRDAPVPDSSHSE